MSYLKDAISLRASNPIPANEMPRLVMLLVDPRGKSLVSQYAIKVNLSRKTLRTAQ